MPCSRTAATVTRSSSSSRSRRRRPCRLFLTSLIVGADALVLPTMTRYYQHSKNTQLGMIGQSTRTRTSATTTRTTSATTMFAWESNSNRNTNTDFPKRGESQVFDGTDEDSEMLDDIRYAQSMQEWFFIDECLRWIPMAIPVLAYVMYDPTAELFALSLELLANNNWVAVDGGQYQAKIIAPAINGVVVPAISILFANLIGTTISTLRQRQLDIRTSINMEAGQLRILQSMLDVFPNPHDQQTSRRYLTQYTSRLIAESQPTVHVDALGDYSLDTELNAFLAELNRLASKSTRTDVPSDLILDNAYTACSKLYEERAKRVTALRSLFPALHFIIVAALAVSICVAFLLESNQVLLVFLNAIQLRILWTMLVGTFSALAIVCYDLGNPFRGSYQISKSVDQLYTIRSALRASLLIPIPEPLAEVGVVVGLVQQDQVLVQVHQDQDQEAPTTTMTILTNNGFNVSNGASSSFDTATATVTETETVTNTPNGSVVTASPSPNPNANHPPPPPQ